MLLTGLPARLWDSSWLCAAPSQAPVSLARTSGALRPFCSRKGLTLLDVGGTESMLLSLEQRNLVSGWHCMPMSPLLGTTRSPLTAGLGLAGAWTL